MTSISHSSCPAANSGIDRNPAVNIERLIAEVPLFSELSAPEIARLTGAARLIRAEKDDILFYKGDCCHGFYLIVSGKVKLIYNLPNGNEKVIELLNRGQTFGEAQLFLDEPYVLSAQALVDSQFIHIGKQSVMQVLESSPLLARKLIGCLSRNLYQLVQHQEFNGLRTGKQRVVDYLLRQVAPDDAHNVCPLIILPASKGTIASHLGITSEHFSRILHKLAESKLIYVHGKRVQILEQNQMRDILDISSGAVSEPAISCRPCSIQPSRPNLQHLYN